jgi:predicted nucleotidyltransferase
LRALYRLPEGLPASGREIARRAGITHPTALKALNLLADAGLVDVTRAPVGDAYVLNRDHVLAEPVLDLLEAEASSAREIATYVRDRMLALTDKVRSATLFGSVVWGGSSTTSDLDLAVSCAATDIDEVEKAMNDLSEEVRRRFGNHLSPIVDVRRKQAHIGIWRRIEEEGVPLIRSGRAVES